ncbi:hypothetical protein Tco_0765936 [Tanacetum coccineum]
MAASFNNPSYHSIDETKVVVCDVVLGYRDHLNILEWVEEALEHVQGKGGGKFVNWLMMVMSADNGYASADDAVRHRSNGGRERKKEAQLEKSRIDIGKKTSSSGYGRGTGAFWRRCVASVTRVQRISKSQRSSNSTASSGSNPLMYQEMVKEQYELDRKAKMEIIERETNERMKLYHSQRIAEDMKVLQIDTRGINPDDAAIINAQKARVRASYPPPN